MVAVGGLQKAAIFPHLTARCYTGRGYFSLGVLGALGESIFLKMLFDLARNAKSAKG